MFLDSPGTNGPPASAAPTAPDNRSPQGSRQAELLHVVGCLRPSSWTSSTSRRLVTPPPPHPRGHRWTARTEAASKSWAVATFAHPFYQITICLLISATPVAAFRISLSLVDTQRDDVSNTSSFPINKPLELCLFFSGRCHLPSLRLPRQDLSRPAGDTPTPCPRSPMSWGKPTGRAPGQVSISDTGNTAVQAVDPECCDCHSVCV